MKFIDSNNVYNWVQFQKKLSEKAKVRGAIKIKCDSLYNFVQDYMRDQMN